jgi:hypothetical protein
LWFICSSKCYYNIIYIYIYMWTLYLGLFVYLLFIKSIGPSLLIIHLLFTFSHYNELPWISMNYMPPISPCHDAILRLHLSKHHPKMLNIFWNPNGFVCAYILIGVHILLHKNLLLSLSFRFLRSVCQMEIFSNPY